MRIISSFLPFPPISWWIQVIAADEIIFDRVEHFEKMSYRNRYYISGANNPIQLSIPLTNGRNQRLPMEQVTLHNIEKWQVSHWRTLVSVYKRTPYWEYYEASLQHIFEIQFNNLIDFNKATIVWAVQQLKLKQESSEAAVFIADYGNGFIDLRRIKPSSEAQKLNKCPQYYQVFQDRIGFQPNLSILDLLFSEGPLAKVWIEANRALI